MQFNATSAQLIKNMTQSHVKGSLANLANANNWEISVGIFKICILIQCIFIYVNCGCLGSQSSAAKVSF